MYRVTDEPDTLPFAAQVLNWMERKWRHGPCPVCGEDKWRAEGRAFRVPRVVLPPVLFPPVFPVVCEGCGHTIWIDCTIAGLNDSPVPDDLSGLN